MSAAGPTQGAKAPSGGSEPRPAGSVGVAPHPQALLDVKDLVKHFILPRESQIGRAS